MSSVSPISTPIALPILHVPAESSSITKMTTSIIRALGLLFSVIGVICFFVSLHVTGISMLIAGVASLIFGFVIKSAPPHVEIAHVEPARVVDVEPEAKKFVQETIAAMKIMKCDILPLDLGERQFVLRKTKHGAIVQSKEDSEANRNNIGFYFHQEITRPVLRRFETEEAESLMPRCMAALAAENLKTILDEVGDMEKLFRRNHHPYYTNSAASFHNFVEALKEYAKHGDLHGVIEAINAAGVGAIEQPTSVKETFEWAMNRSIHGGVRDTLSVIAEDPEVSKKMKETSDAIQRILPVVEALVR